MTQCATPTVGKLCLAKRDQSDFSRDTWGCKSSSCHKFALCSGRIRDGEEEGEARGGEHDYAIISLCRHTHELQSVFFFGIATVASSVEFSASAPTAAAAVAATFAHAQTIFQSFFTDYSTVFAQQQHQQATEAVAAQSQQLPSSLLYTPLPLRCFSLPSSVYWASVAAAPLALLSLFAAQPSPLPSISSSAVALRCSLSLSHQHPLFALHCRSLIMFCCCSLVPCCSAATVSASVTSLSLSVVIMAISCALVWFSASLPCLTVHCACCLYSNFLALPPSPILSCCLCCRWTELLAALNWQARRGGAGKFKLWLPLWGSATYSQLQPELNST